MSPTCGLGCRKGGVGTLPCRVVDILTYGCAVGDSMLNYLLLFFTTVTLWVVCKDVSGRRGVGTSFFCGVNAFLWAFQIILCLLIEDDCVGISIVWSSHCGIFLFVLARRSDWIGDKLRWLVQSCVGTCILIMVYYACVEVPITTVAHIAAIIMGAIIAKRCLN
mmetsp:Transcript_3104/g.4449  ORF Transcript_3104/g.4449 Transcript_3104/m.4449 type:complete len:164 (+) Transcript_3104:330-821(+)